MDTPSAFNDALARLDAEIAAAEQHLAELRFKRKGAEAFLAYMQDATPGRPSVRSVPPARPLIRGDGPTETVFSVMEPRVVYTVDSAREAVAVTGIELTREQVRNALHYLVRKEAIIRAGRGAWIRDAEAPVAAGASEGNTGPSEEGGDSHETDEAASSPAEDQHHPQLGASITGVAV